MKGSRRRFGREYKVEAVRQISVINAVVGSLALAITCGTTVRYYDDNAISNVMTIEFER